jgi:hypothetical protein
LSKSKSSLTAVTAVKLAKFYNKNSMLFVDLRFGQAHAAGWRPAMTEDIKLPRKLSDEPKAPKPRRASHEKVIENLDRWANSPGLQPPTSQDSKAT